MLGGIKNVSVEGIVDCCMCGDVDVVFIEGVYAACVSDCARVGACMRECVCVRDGVLVCLHTVSLMFTHLEHVGLGFFICAKGLS